MKDNIEVDIHVSEANIKDGKSKMADLCPVALAMKDAGFRDIYVSPINLICSSDEPMVYYGRLPLDAHQFVCNFDKGAPVEPATFHLKLESVYERAT